MKGINYRAILLLVLLLFVSALSAQQRALKITKDCDATDTLGNRVKLFCDSKFLVSEVNDYVKILSVNNDNKDENASVGIKEGAFLKCKSIDQNLSKVRYIDNNNKERYDVPGVGSNIELYKQIKLQSNSDTLFIPSDCCVPLSAYYQPSNFANNLSYEPETQKISVNADLKCKIVINGIITTCDSSGQKIIANVDNNAEIKVIFPENNYLDFDIKVKDIETIAPVVNPDENSVFSQFLQEHYLLFPIGFLVLILLMGYMIYNRRKKDSAISKGKEPSAVDFSKLTVEVEKVKVHTDKVVKLLDSIDGSLYNYKNQKDANELLQSKEQEIKRLSGEVEKITGEYNSLNTKSKEAIANLEERISILEKDLSDAQHPDGAITLNGTSGFVTNVFNLMTIGRKAEKTILNYLNQLNETDAKNFSHFIRQYVSSIDPEMRDKWNSILSTLSIKGYVKDVDAIKYLNAKGCETDEAKLDWLKKFIYEEFLQNYLSALTVMLESIRFSKSYGLSLTVNKDVEDYLKKLISMSKNVGITIHYVQLGESLNEYSNVEISSKLPDGIVVPRVSNKPVLIRKYGMLCDKSTKTSKTEIVQLD